MNKHSDHYYTGAHHALLGFRRYKWQDPYNQEEYDKGYNAVESEDRWDLEEAVKRWLKGR